MAGARRQTVSVSLRGNAKGPDFCGHKNSKISGKSDNPTGEGRGPTSPVESV